MSTVAVPKFCLVRSGGSIVKLHTQDEVAQAWQMYLSLRDEPLIEQGEAHGLPTFKPEDSLEFSDKQRPVGELDYWCALTYSGQIAVYDDGSRYQLSDAAYARFIKYLKSTNDKQSATTR